MSESVVSVIVRTRDRADFLARALASIAEQGDSATEAVVVNDGGPAAPVERAVEAARRGGLAITLVRHEASCGRGAAWNAGWRAARGEWLTALDDDDTWEPDFLRSVRAEVAAAGVGRGGALFGVVTQTMEIHELPDVAGAWVEIGRRPFNPGLKAVSAGDLAVLNRFTNNAFVFPRAALGSVGHVREDLDVLEDWEFNLRFAEAFPLRVLARPLAHYRRRELAGGGAAANTAPARHLVVRAELREAWLRRNWRTARWGRGLCGVIARVMYARLLKLGRASSETDGEGWAVR